MYNDQYRDAVTEFRHAPNTLGLEPYSTATVLRVDSASESLTFKPGTLFLSVCGQVQEEVGKYLDVYLNTPDLPKEDRRLHWRETMPRSRERGIVRDTTRLSFFCDVALS